MGSARASREPESDWNCLSVQSVPVRGLAWLFISVVTQCLVECRPQPVLKTEMLAERGQDPEQDTASSGPPGQEASHRETEQSDWGPRGELWGVCQALMLGEEHVTSDFSFLRAKGPQMV